MDKVAQALKNIAGFVFYKVPFVRQIEQFIQSGDESLFKQIPPGAAAYAAWEGQLIAALRPPEQWGEPDRRIARLMTHSGRILDLTRWLARELPREKPERDFFAVVRDSSKASD